MFWKKRKMYKNLTSHPANCVRTKTKINFGTKISLEGRRWTACSGLQLHHWLPAAEATSYKLQADWLHGYSRQLSMPLHCSSGPTSPLATVQCCFPVPVCSDMAVGPVFVTQTNPTHHFFNPTQPNRSMTNIPLHTITNVISQNTSTLNC